MKRLHSDKPEGQIRPMEEDCLELVAALRAEVRTLRERQKIFRLVPSPAQEAAIAKLAEYLDIMERHSRAIEKPMKEALARADEGAVWHTQDEFNKVVLIIEEIVESVADDQPMGPDIVEARLLRRMA